MNILLLLLLASGPEVKKLLEIPGQLMRPSVSWDDLNQDGILDIWVHDNNQSLWVWDGASTGTSLLRIPFDPIGFKVRPVWAKGVWRASAYERGRVYHFEPGQGWTIQTDYQTLGRIRPGLEPIEGKAGTLVPTFEGYRLMERRSTCLLQAFETLPAIQLDSRILSLRYPVPVWRDVDGDQREDLLAAPIVFPQQGEIGVWSALRTEQVWSDSWSRLLFPVNHKIEQHQYGDINGDGYDDLVLVTRPEQDSSIFEELSFMVYLGTGFGKWDPVSVQQLKTKQNIWQTGPIEVNSRGVYLYYYKGLFRSKFKIDFFKWNEAGYLTPNPVSVKWVLKDADERTIILDHDLNGDGHTDLILSSEKGVFAYYREPKAKLPFSNKVDRTLLRKETRDGILDVSSGFSISRSVSKNHLRGEGSLTLITSGEGSAPAFWTMYCSDKGAWYLKEL